MARALGVAVALVLVAVVLAQACTLPVLDAPYLVNPRMTPDSNRILVSIAEPKEPYSSEMKIVGEAVVLLSAHSIEKAKSSDIEVTVPGPLLSPQPYTTNVTQNVGDNQTVTTYSDVDGSVLLTLVIRAARSRRAKTIVSASQNMAYVTYRDDSGTQWVAMPLNEKPATKVAWNITIDGQIDFTDPFEIFDNASILMAYPMCCVCIARLVYSYWPNGVLQAQPDKSMFDTRVNRLLFVPSYNKSPTIHTFDYRTRSQEYFELSEAQILSVYHELEQQGSWWEYVFGFGAGALVVGGAGAFGLMWYLRRKRAGGPGFETIAQT